MDSAIKEMIIQRLDTLPVHHVSSNGIQHVVRCPYCGDSQNPSHAHFSMRIDTSDPLDPILFRCLKCSTSGLVTQQVLEDLQIDLPADAVQGLTKLTRLSSRAHKITAIKTENFKIPVPRFDDTTMKKVSYLNNRLGLHYNANDYTALNCIINLGDFMQMNHINKAYMGSECTPWTLRFLDEHYVGFLGKNRNVITCRYLNDVDPSKLKFEPSRYLKPKFNPNNLDPNSYYSIPNKIDIMYTNEINIHIAEGPFDIIGVLEHVMNGELENNFYYAVCGFGYGTILRNIISAGLNTGLNVHIYADNDKKDNEIINPLKYGSLWPWINHLYLHRNASGEKDYGVSVDKISDTKRKIK